MGGTGDFLLPPTLVRKWSFAYSPYDADIVGVMSSISVGIVRGCFQLSRVGLSHWVLDLVQKRYWLCEGLEGWHYCRLGIRSDF